MGGWLLWGHPRHCRPDPLGPQFTTDAHTRKLVFWKGYFQVTLMYLETFDHPGKADWCPAKGLLKILVPGIPRVAQPCLGPLRPPVVLRVPPDPPEVLRDLQNFPAVLGDPKITQRCSGPCRVTPSHAGDVGVGWT